MKRPAIGKALVLCAALSLPALAAAPAAQPKSSGASNARVIVKYKGEGSLMRESALAVRAGEPVQAQHAARLSQRLGVRLTDGTAIAPRTQVLHANGLSSAELVARLKADPEVEHVEVDARVKRADVPNDPMYAGGQPVITPAAGQWYLRPTNTTFVSAINAQAAWDATIGSPAVVVAILDTGVRRDHPDLAGKLLPGYDFVTADAPNDFTTANDGNGVDSDPSDPGDWVTQAESEQVGGVLEGCDVGDSSWHGTQTAALVGAATNNSFGMASVGRNVRVLPVRVLGKCGGFISDVIAGMRWAAGISSTPVPNPTPAKVMNLSLGSPGACAGTLYDAAVADVIAAGVSVVVSAGNDVGRAVGKPANCPGAIGVGGLRHTGTKVGFSDVGTEIALSAPGGNCVNTFGTCLYPILTATNAGATVPGANTFSDGDNNFSVGTSFSAPLVAGAAGLMLSVNPTLTPAQLRAALRSSSRAFPTTGGSPNIVMCQAPTGAVQDECYCTTATCGAGMLDVAAAVAAAGAPATSQAVAVATPAVPAPTESVTLDASASVPSSGRTITAYEWTMVDGGGIATLGVTTNASTADVTTTGAGAFTVRLRATDSGNFSDTVDLRVTVAVPLPVDNGNASNPSNGGGSLSWPWLFALGVAVAVLRPRRSL